MSKSKIHKLPIPEPTTEPENPPKKRCKQRTNVTKLHKTLLDEIIEGQPEESVWQRFSYAMKGIGHSIYEGAHKFFGTCLGELVLMCVACILIAGLVVLILKLMGEV